VVFDDKYFDERALSETEPDDGDFALWASLDTSVEALVDPKVREAYAAYLAGKRESVKPTP
jgi:hypothetical protein